MGVLRLRRPSEGCSECGSDHHALDIQDFNDHLGDFLGQAWGVFLDPVAGVASSGLIRF